MSGETEKQRPKRKMIMMKMKIDLSKAHDVRDATLRNDPSMALPPSLRVNRNELSEIEDWLFISGEMTAADPEILEKTEIGYIINAAIGVAKTGFPQKFKYLAFDMSDDTEQDLSSFIFHAIDFLTNLRKANKKNKCLVHCHAGISRSVSLVLSYLMYANKFTFDEALAEVRTRRSVACPNISFEFQLKNFQVLLQTHKPSHVVYSKLRPHINSSIYPIYIARALTVGSENSLIGEKTTIQMLTPGDSPYYPLDSIFDSRGCFVVFAMEGNVYIWVGSLSHQNEFNACKTYCDQIERIIGTPKHTVIRENEETVQFLKEAHLYPPQRKLHLHKRYNVEYPVIKNEKLLIRYPDWRLLTPQEADQETETPIICIQPKNFSQNSFGLGMSQSNFVSGDTLSIHQETPPLQSLELTESSSYFFNSTTSRIDRKETQEYLNMVQRTDSPKKRSNTILNGTENSFTKQKYNIKKYKMTVFIPMHFPRFSTMQGNRCKENLELLSERADCVQTTGNIEVVQQFLQNFGLNPEEVETAVYFSSTQFGVFAKQNL
ncbi:dual specificity protein phosphatase, putative [Entamoeba dispar SAW760]|uniref:Dual specificity protein phosphatase, putative n=1 Tax=Entamoeba dispar (strain ATCC PRA-260 / SAW760) TaxID=370354 RepID=B0EPX9_ENTDS|nr:dual specificity protein phosphatase, putative [Entamoeba dispar SAW760]EDR23448.1 dual specificity protein phosphatase, putative [Entamoeba dispar SAW760]|eukprot:EDR23448.1 dual specificity protein phosphatase, putative [Entamoeba dispar SAW760]